MSSETDAIRERWTVPDGKREACDGYCCAPQDIPFLIAALAASEARVKKLEAELAAMTKNFLKAP